MTVRPCEVCGSSEFRHLFLKDGQEFFRCRSCGLCRSDPQPSDDELTRVYGRAYFNAWGVQADAARVLQLKKDTFRKYVFRAVDVPKDARVLDCGAAFGTLMGAAAEAGWKPYGVELVSEAAAEIVRCFGSERVFSGPFEKASFPGLGEAAFAAVFMCDFIEHVRDPLATLRKAWQLLQPGGRLVLTTPDTGSLSCRLMGRAWPLYLLEHLHCFNRRNLTMLLERAGFAVTSTGWARKVIDLEYICHHLNAHPRPLLTTGANLLARCGGPRLRSRQWSLALGQMLVVGIKGGCCPAAAAGA